MPEEYYKEANKLAQKEYRIAVQKKEEPGLLVLDELLPKGRRLQEKDLGILQIPAVYLVGTKTSGRANAFARNFMPLAEEDSEFARKWKNLCQAHLDEGIRDPLKVYEYRNRYYVEEGNKRASVLKFFGAVQIPAQVIRIYPEPSEDLPIKLYYELLDFASYSHVQYIEFSRPGCYDELQRVLGKKEHEEWSEGEGIVFLSAYTNFSTAYELKGGNELPITVGDAFLAYIKVYGIQELRYGNARKIADRLAKLWEEIELLQQEESIDLKLEREDEKKPDLITQILQSALPRLKKAAFIHDDDPERSAWIYNHEQGRAYVEHVFGGKIETKAYYTGKDPNVIDEAVKEGYTLIFTTSPRLLYASLKAAVKYPHVTILNCSLNVAHRYIRTYYARMYEAKYIMGAIAGSLAGSHNVGYICDYPIYGQIAGINAFALGVQLTNPKANVCLDWSGTDSVNAAIRRLRQKGVNLISSADLAGSPGKGMGIFGLSLVTDEGSLLLAKPQLKWGVYYEAIIRQIMNKTFQSEYAESGRALNYFWGMGAGVVALSCSDQVPDGCRKLVTLLEKGICSGIAQPFHGSLYDQSGRLRQTKHGDMTMQEIIRMDWLVENVVGSIPKYQELTEIGKETVEIVGVEPVMKPVDEKAEC